MSTEVRREGDGNERIQELWAGTFAVHLMGLRTNTKSGGSIAGVLVEKGALDQGVPASAPLTDVWDRVTRRGGLSCVSLSSIAGLHPLEAWK